MLHLNSLLYGKGIKIIYCRFVFVSVGLLLSFIIVVVVAPVNDIIQVTMYIVDRGLTDPLFTNKPLPLWTTCPVWIRPRTLIYTLQSYDKVTYGADVQFQLESGKKNFLLTCSNLFSVWLLLLVSLSQHQLQFVHYCCVKSKYYMLLTAVMMTSIMTVNRYRTLKWLMTNVISVTCCCVWFECHWSDSCKTC